MMRVSRPALLLATVGALLSVQDGAAFMARPATSSLLSTSLSSTTEENKNVAQTEDTSRDKIMTFSYDMSTEAKYEKPTYPGTGNGLSGDCLLYTSPSPRD